MTPGRPFASWQAPATHVLLTLAAPYGGAFPPLLGGRILRSVADELGVPQDSLGRLAEALGIWDGLRGVAAAVQADQMAEDADRSYRTAAELIANDRRRR